MIRIGESTGIVGGKGENMDWRNFFRLVIIILLNMFCAFYLGAITASFFREDWAIVFGGVLYLIALVIVYACKILRKQNEILEALKNKEEQ